MSSPRANGGSCSAIANSRARGPGSVSNQTLKADEANYRAALALIARSSRRAVSDRQFRSLADTAQTRSRPQAHLVDAQVTGVGPWTSGQGAHVRSSSKARPRRSAPPISPTRRFPRSRPWRSRTCNCAKPILCTICSRTRSDNTSGLSTSLKTSTTRATAAKSDVITAQALLLAAQASGNQHRRRARSRTSTRSRC